MLKVLSVFEDTLYIPLHSIKYIEVLNTCDDKYDALWYPYYAKYLKGCSRIDIGDGVWFDPARLIRYTAEGLRAASSILGLKEEYFKYLKSLDLSKASSPEVSLYQWLFTRGTLHRVWFTDEESLVISEFTRWVD